MNTPKVFFVVALVTIMLMVLACSLSVPVYPHDFSKPQHATDLIKALDHDYKINQYRWENHIGDEVTIYGMIRDVVRGDYVSSAYHIEIGYSNMDRPSDIVECWMRYDQIIDLSIEQHVTVTGNLDKLERSESKARYILKECFLTPERKTAP